MLRWRHAESLLSSGWGECQITSFIPGWGDQLSSFHINVSGQHRSKACWLVPWAC